MEQEDAIVITDVSKKFKVYLDKGQSFKERLLFRKRNKFENRVVLDGVSFKVKKGEAIGLIGHNGCGKSTMLKLMTRILYPDSGKIELKGRVSSLIELGAGFHPDMSGRENIYTNASIFGLTKKEIDERLNDIISFSELEKFIDNPVRTYSSGMYMRLAFSVAINVNADILLIDEILAVGDSNFQAKCFARLQEIKAQGATIVIVSHAMNQIEQICDRSVWIHEGKIRAEGAPRDVHPMYREYMGSRISSGSASRGDGGNRWGNMDAEISDVRLMNRDGEEVKSFQTGSYMKIHVDFTMNKPVEKVVYGMAFYNINGTHCYGTNTLIDELDEMSLSEDGSFEFEVESLDLLPGEYILDLSIETNTALPVDYYKDAARFVMYSPIGDVGCSRVNHSWNINGKNY